MNEDYNLMQMLKK